MDKRVTYENMVGESSELAQNLDIKPSSPLNDISILETKLQQLKVINSQNKPDQIIIETLTHLESEPAISLLKTIADQLKKEPECPSIALDQTVAVVSGQTPSGIRFDSRTNPGEYMTHSGKIALNKNYEKWTPQNVISELIFYGRDQLTTVIRHEMIHADQALPTTFQEIVASLKRRFYKSDKMEQDMLQHLLSEIQAYTKHVAR